MERFRFHVVALPYTQTNLDHCGCAYTLKVWNFCRMMMSLGHEVIHYGVEGSDVMCSEHVQVMSLEEQRQLFGDYDWKKEMYRIEWDASKLYWQLFNSKTAMAIMKRQKPNDFLCLIGGVCHKPIADALPTMMPVEFGIGYTGVWSPFRVFESNAHMHRMLGAMEKDPNGHWYDAVIPNYFDPEMFPTSEEREDHMLFVGRLIARKGIKVSADVSIATKVPLHLAGQGMKEYEPGKLTCQDNTVLEAPGLKYIGFLDHKQKAVEMAKAKAVIAPTMYLEPFGGVTVEAQLCGTPVITTNFGAFPEIVEHGKTGFRCQTLEQFIYAVNHVDELDRGYIRRRAQATWSIWRVRHLYQEYFTMLHDIQVSQGWNTIRERTNKLDWLNPVEVPDGETSDNPPTQVGAGGHGAYDGIGAGSTSPVSVQV